MTIPGFSDVHDTVLATDSELHERVTTLLSRALRRQLWLLFLDEDGRQLPLMMPADIPKTPGDREAKDFGNFLHGVMTDSGAATLVPVLERRGNDRISATDVAWFRIVHAACASSELRYRGPLLCHDHGLRWIGLEDFLDPTSE